jgi:hypothetical protein
VGSFVLVVAFGAEISRMYGHRQFNLQHLELADMNDFSKIGGNFKALELWNEMDCEAMDTASFDF